MNDLYQHNDAEEFDFLNNKTAVKHKAICDLYEALIESERRSNDVRARYIAKGYYIAEVARRTGYVESYITAIINSHVRGRDKKHHSEKRRA